MINELREFIERLNDPLINKTSVIKWASPILSFGKIETSKIATIGINPSNKEFVDGRGLELSGYKRRFHTLTSLELKNWNSISDLHLNNILELSDNYFINNPYDVWFKKLDYIISGANASFYFPIKGACHLDLIPYATLNKWADLSTKERTILLDISKDSLGLLLKKSPINALILNGQTVVDYFEEMSKINLDKRRMPSWDLPRATNPIKGYSYSGIIDSINGAKLRKAILVLGYNHNIQSSYGVTNKVLFSIRNWISKTFNQSVL